MRMEKRVKVGRQVRRKEEIKLIKGPIVKVYVYLCMCN